MISEERYAFQYFLRTGRRVPPLGSLELKFNPYHDPRNGQFTFAPGGPRSLSNVVVSERRKSSPGSRSNQTVSKAGVAPLPYLTSLHNEIRDLAAKYPPKPGTNEWTAEDLLRLLSDEATFDFKRQWVHGYRDAINAAADRFDLPRELVAGVAFIEVGGDPLPIDDIAYGLRKTTSRDRTSIGNMSVQVRRAIRSLGYDTSSDLSPSQRRMIITSLKNPQTSIFVAAKHLSDLRNRDYEGVSALHLNKNQIEVIATRFNFGPDLSSADIQKSLGYGRYITKRWSELGKLIKQ